MSVQMINPNEHSTARKWQTEENLVNQIRREMRFFQGKALPGYSAETAAQLHQQLKVNLMKVKRSPLTTAAPPNEMYPVIRMFEHLVNDLELYLKERDDLEPHKRAEDVNVLAPTKQLILVLQRRLNTNLNLNGNDRTAP